MQGLRKVFLSLFLFDRIVSALKNYLSRSNAAFARPDSRTTSFPGVENI
jgi:hypothetical protein